MQEFCRAVEGSRRKDKRREHVSNHRAKTRTGCNALIVILEVDNGKWKGIASVLICGLCGRIQAVRCVYRIA
ncbi:hypothetical protein QJS04_geneDACA024358 [Acorus gramineus]|uniref:FAR1 domain-containing protein n=1 Tax=Acorus gramineus TaxID=55184 RepID=A0AAV9BUV2_ACOGR|nr:hypothetical protein QJS04_geneDACA024358 [Acorus gramineus]